LFNTARAERRIVRTEPIALRVRSLPTGAQPDKFEGGVGTFELDASLSNGTAKVGESVTLTVELSGAGNIRDVADPEINIEGVKTYSDNPTIEVKNRDDTIVGKKVYKIALVPQEAKEIGIPKISVPYFNPETRRYELASSVPLKLTVLPSEEESLMVTKAPTAEGERKRPVPSRQDILPIHERLDTIESSAFEVWWRRLRPVVYPLPLLVYSVFFASVKRRERLQTDTAYRRSTFAARSAQTRIEGAGHAMRHRKWGEVFSECSRAVTEYLADKLNVPAGGLTATDVEQALLSRDVPESFVKEIVRFLEKCDYGRFASSVDNANVAEKYIAKAKQIIDRLEHEGIIKS
jgi:hypothetical protein